MTAYTSTIRRLDELNPAGYNPRKITSDELEQLRRSIEQWGMVEPLVVNSRGDVIIGGHQRARAAASLGIEEVPVIEVDLDDDQAKALNLALNKLGGDWDRPRLTELLATLDDYLVDLAGFAVDLSDPPELRPVKFESKGSAWSAGEHRIRAPHPEGADCATCATLRKALE